MTQEKIVLQPGAAAETDGLKIIGAGFGRTGTRSLKEALEMLGFGPCYHMVEVFEHPDHVALWEQAARGEPVDWQDIFHEYRATVDWPACTFYKELMAAYPNAKVLLSVRDPEKWYESARSTIYRVNQRRPAFSTALVLFIFRFVRPGIARGAPMVKRLIWQGTFQDRFEDKEHAIAIFNQHNEEVKNYVPTETLLVYSVKDGWEPLCAFLGVPVPDAPFPHLNDRENFPGNNMRQDIQKRFVQGALIATAAVAGVLFLRKLLRRNGH